jgi:hypothetical protein
MIKPAQEVNLILSLLMSLLTKMKKLGAQHNGS